jgi:hypothetical protein
VPFRISQNNKSFNLFAVWTKSGDYGLYAYDKNVISAAKAPEYQKLFNEGAVLIGDFNTFAKNDSGLQGLEEKLFPLINCSKNTRFWKTFTYCHGKNNLGIDDFCFSSDSLMQKICDIKFSVYDEWTIDPKNNVKRWRGFSDHCPISVEFEI